MYDLNSLLTKIVTVKTNIGMEIIAQLVGVDEENFTISLRQPKLVVITEGNVATMPFTFTGEGELIFLTRDQYIAVLETAKPSAEDYLKQVK